MDLGSWLGVGAISISTATLLFGLISLKNKQRDTRISELSGEVADLRHRLAECEEQHKFVKQDIQRLREENFSLMRRLIQVDQNSRRRDPGGAAPDLILRDEER